MIIPPKENIEKIFRIYANQCSFGDCFKKIIDSDNHVNGNIVFVESNKKNHPRYNPKLTNEQMEDVANLLMFCDIHAYELEYNTEQFTVSRLKSKITQDLKNLPDSNFEFSAELWENFLHHFIDYHDPDRFSNFTLNAVLDPNDKFSPGGDWWIETSYVHVLIRPTKHFTGGKFEIIDYKRKFREYDKVVFYSKDSTYTNGIQADIEIKSAMRIEGLVPPIPKGEYLVSVRSSLDEKSKLEEDLEFTIL